MRTEQGAWTALLKKHVPNHPQVTPEHAVDILKSKERSHITKNSEYVVPRLAFGGMKGREGEVAVKKQIKRVPPHPPAPSASATSSVKGKKTKKRKFDFKFDEGDEEDLYSNCFKR